MSDLVAMLRVSESDPVQQEAADEIERLREENARLLEALKQCEQALQAESTYHAEERWLYLIDRDKANAACAAAAAIREGGNDG